VRAGAAWAEWAAGAAGGDEGESLAVLHSKPPPDLPIADRLLKLCLRGGSNEHDEGDGECGVRGMRMGR
jgi:hypothetical protein